MIDLPTLNAQTPADFTTALDGVFEHSPWVAQQAATQRPFETLAELHAALMQIVRDAPEPELLAFLNLHPELAAEKLPADLTEASQSEQRGLAMAAAAGAADLPALNADYRARFAFPFIVCVARHTGENVMRTLRARLANDLPTERQTALDEIAHITRLRLQARITGPAAPSGHLSTHALDTQTGRPAAELAVTLLRESVPIVTAKTNHDGRISTGLLPEGLIRQGLYDLVFHAGAYFAAQSRPTFYDTIPIRFVVDHAEGRYHIPLLLAPYAYTTYRGS